MVEFTPTSTSKLDSAAALSSSNVANTCRQSPSFNSSPLPPSIARLWKPAAQRNLRNQWSKLASHRKQWVSCSSTGRAHATSLVNAYLSQRYMPSMELGVLSDMPDIRKKASEKLFKQQELQRSKLLAAYKDMVMVVTDMEKGRRSMRSFLKKTGGGSLVQFSNCCEDINDRGDGGGIAVFTFSSISDFEKMAEELVEMFELELILKRLLVLQLLSISEVPPANVLSWTDELYQGEFDDLNICNLYSRETCEPLPPRLKNGKFEKPAAPCDLRPNDETLQVHLTTWLAEVNIDSHRVDEIFAVIAGEMHCTLS